MADQLIASSAGTTTTTFSYDARGNQLTDGSDAYRWDSSGRLTGITSTSATVTYGRDPLDRLRERREGTTVVRYSYGGFNDTPIATYDSNWDKIEDLLSLPGGIALNVSAQNPSQARWSYPDLKGHIIASSDSNGDRLAGTSISTYDPWGSQYPEGSTAPDTAIGNADLAAYGSAGKLTEHATTKQVVLMGARPYSAIYGRFLSVDPIEGGCANNYVYVHGDPLNTSDLSGRAETLSCWGFVHESDHFRYEGGISGNQFTVNITPREPDLAIFAYDAYIDYVPAPFGARRHKRADVDSGNPLVLQPGVVISPGGRIKGITINLHVIGVEVTANQGSYFSEFAEFSCKF